MSPQGGLAKTIALIIWISKTALIILFAFSQNALKTCYHRLVIIEKFVVIVASQLCTWSGCLPWIFEDGTLYKLSKNYVLLPLKCSDNFHTLVL